MRADGLGLYSLGGLPIAADVVIWATGSGLVGQLPVETGTTPGAPGSAACKPVEPVACVGPS